MKRETNKQNELIADVAQMTQFPKMSLDLTTHNFKLVTNQSLISLSIDIRQVLKRRRPRLSWAGQMRQRQRRFGLTQQLSFLGAVTKNIALESYIYCTHSENSILHTNY